MKAIVHSEYGGPEVLHLTEVETPTPGPSQVLVKVHAAALNPVDWHFVRGVPFPARIFAGGLRRPRRHRRVGGDFSGIVAAIGPGVTGFTVGDPVFGYGEGTLAEYLTVKADMVAAKPRRVTFEQAAGVPIAGLAALQALRDHAPVRPGDNVLIVGAAGGIGTFAVQIAKAFGAAVITGVQSTAALDLVRSLGADRVIDYTKEDFTIGEMRYDVIFDNVSNRPLREVLRVLKSGGTVVPNGGGSTPDRSITAFGMMRLLATRPFIRQKVALFGTKPNGADLGVLADMTQAGAITPVIDRCYPITAAADAMRHVESGHAHGKVVVTIAPSDSIRS